MAVSMLLAHPDPVRAFWQACESGSDIGLTTSGTLSQPRAVVRSASSWITSFAAYSELAGIDADSRVWIPGPLSASMNLFAAIHADYVHARIVDTESDATHAVLTPSQLKRFLDTSVGVGPCHVIVAGDGLRCSLRDRALAEGHAVSHYFGASELSFIAWGTAENDLLAFPGVEIDIRDDVIWCRSTYLARAYGDNAAGPLEFDAAGFATVGDRGRFEDGFLRVHGRGDVAVTTAGATVLVAEVEQVLRAYARGEVVVLGIPHAHWGAVIIGVVTETSDIDRLSSIAMEQLSVAQRPRRWIHVPDLPMTPVGKVDRSALAVLVGAGEDA